MDTTKYDYTNSENSSSYSRKAHAEEKARLLYELRHYLETNNPPILSDLVTKMKPLVNFRYVSLSDLLLLINGMIHPLKLHNNQSEQVVVTEAWELHLELKDRRDRDSKNTVTLRLIKNGVHLILDTPDKSFLLNTFKPGSSPSKLFDYFMENENKIVQFGTAKFESESTSYKSAPSDLLRKSGVSVKLANHFFPVRSKTEVKFVGRVVVPNRELPELIFDLPNFRNEA